MGKEAMQEVIEKKYLGQIIQSDGRNEKNIKDKTDKAVGNVDKSYLPEMKGQMENMHLKLLTAGLGGNGKSNQYKDRG